MATQFAAPVIGARVKVVTDYSDSVIARHLRQTTHTTIGHVVKSDFRDERGTFNVRRDDNFIANIELARVIRIDYLDRDVAAQTVEVESPAKRDEQTFEVKGSKGDTYIVTFSDRRWTCTCSGFSFRHKCRHIEEAKQIAETNG